MTRIALITGGNRGLGRAAAEQLAADGTDVVITYRSNPDEAEAVVAALREQGRQATAIRLDTTQHETFEAFRTTFIEELRTRWGRADFDILISNAGFDGRTPYGRTDPGLMDDLYKVHVKGPILLTESLTPHLHDGGRVVFLSTGLTRYVANPVYSVYASMKGAIEVYVKYAAKALGPRAITVNAVAPGATATDFGGGMIRDDDDYRAMVTRNHAFGRVGEPGDIGGALLAVTAESAGWITAQRIEASGGQGL
ncbi:SDR family oxidoreductase [Streptomyces sp. ISL-12]|uniref:SDR family NAD(P)-dependent oxidoreductase n=1 Tax=Streptomyces sp. ISL-12 TaxID=2819177 RepID=UPI001BE5E4F1|nr:SDR family oxidoreductase [Streptomyces sp. ISL-12]MBT2415534.1 SDR family oxidoreductase [Streptomyces sp. ISL-12]